MIREIYGKKIGMTQLFNEGGDLLPTTLLEVEPVCVLEKVEYPTKTRARIGVFKIDEKKISKVKKPVKGYFDKLGFGAYRLIREVEVEKDADFSFTVKEEPKAEEPKEAAKQEATPEKAPEIKEASKEAPKEAASQAPQKEEIKEEVKEETQEKTEKGDAGDKKESSEPADPRKIGVEIFKENELVDIRAKSKGKGFAGGMKRHGWSGQPASHGSTMHRRVGSVGASAYPSKIIKGLHMPGHMGNSPRTIKNLKILKVDKERNMLFIEGSVPGSRGTVVKIRKIK